MAPGNGDRRIRGAAEIDRDMRLGDRLDLGERALELIVLAVMVEGLLAGPDPLQNADIFVGSRITLRVIEEIAVALLLGVVTAADHVDGDPPAGELVERRELARRQRRRDEAGAMRQHEAD